MKIFLAVCVLLFATFACAADAPAQNPHANIAVKGEVLEVKNVESYTYLRLKTADGETWAAVSKAKVKKGATVTIENAMTMHDFQSKTLKRTFPVIVFGTLGGAASAHDMAHAGVAPAPVDMSDIHVDKATGEHAYTVAEVMSKGAELKDQTVRVRGKVVKYNAGIMGKNWIHLRDGSGSDTEQNNDLLVTTLSQAKVGDVVTASGVVHADKDFGAGYFYKALLEEATLQ